jgi:cell division protein FtsQ
VSARGAVAGRRTLPRVRMPRLPSGRSLLRALIVVGVLAIALAAGYVFWLRDSSLVAVERVTISGAEGRPEVTGALTRAAEGMSTLDVDEAKLEQAVADLPSVLSVEASADFPHGLEISVDSRAPAAFIEEGGLIVAGDGVVLESGAERPEGLPLIETNGLAEQAPGDRLEGGALALARILEATPEPLLPSVTGSRVDEEHGPVVLVGPGIELRFDDPSRAEAKWAGAAAVLADTGLESAVYIDLTVPDRPVAG